MTPLEFCYWLQGTFELGNTRTLSETQVEILKQHLNLVFTKVTPTVSTPFNPTRPYQPFEWPKQWGDTTTTTPWVTPRDFKMPEVLCKTDTTLTDAMREAMKSGQAGGSWKIDPTKMTLQC